MGTAALGGLYEPVDTEVAAMTVIEAVTSGVRYLDTAPFYGYGQAERILGSALASTPAAEVVVSTKVGHVLGERVVDAEPGGLFRSRETRTVRRGFGRADVEQTLAASLVRLGRDAVDIVYAHDAEGHLDEVMAQTLPTLDSIRQAGVTRAVGIAMSDVAELVEIVSTGAVDCVLVAGRYSLLNQSAGDELFGLCTEQGVAVVNAGVFNSGILAGSSQTFDYAEASGPVADRVAAISAVCTGYDVPLPMAALHFARSHPAVSGILLGPRTPAELRDCQRYLDAPVDPALWDELASRGLVPSGRP